MDQRVSAEWQSFYSVGNTVLDAQHKKLLRLCQRAVLCLDADSQEARAELHYILNDLSVYVREHFDAEESLLRERGYPLLEQHMEEHLAYQTKLMDLLLRATEGSLDKAELATYLTQWWLAHILGSDMRYASYLKLPVRSD
ncbi:MAG: hemerythrin family protein [Dechloromonas sp.]|nr:hemerythrin family protein [Dechloromonas sp.]